MRSEGRGHTEGSGEYLYWKRWHLLITLLAIILGPGVVRPFPVILISAGLGMFLYFSWTPTSSALSSSELSLRYSHQSTVLHISHPFQTLPDPGKLVSSQVWPRTCLTSFLALCVFSGLSSSPLAHVTLGEKFLQVRNDLMHICIPSRLSCSRWP